MTDAVLISFVGAGSSLVGIGMTCFVNYRLGKVHKQINGRMDEYIEIVKEQANTAGKEEQKLKDKK